MFTPSATLGDVIGAIAQFFGAAMTVAGAVWLARLDSRRARHDLEQEQEEFLALVRAGASSLQSALVSTIANLRSLQLQLQNAEKLHPDSELSDELWSALRLNALDCMIEVPSALAVSGTHARFLTDAALTKIADATALANAVNAKLRFASDTLNHKWLCAQARDYQDRVLNAANLAHSQVVELSEFLVVRRPDAVRVFGLAGDKPAAE